MHTGPCPVRGMLTHTITTVLFDYGGVMAEEGFRQGLLEIGRKAGLDPVAFFHAVEALIYETGYLTGKADEPAFWNAVRKRTGVTGDDAGLREELLSRFVLRQDMVSLVDMLRAKGITVALLSDQTNWLDTLDERTELYRHFDKVFNSYRIGMSKRDSAVFRYACDALGTRPGETLFVDDNAGHIARARVEGLNTIQCAVAADCICLLGNALPPGTIMSGGGRGV